LGAGQVRRPQGRDASVLLNGFNSGTTESIFDSRNDFARPKLRRPDVAEALVCATELTVQ